MSEICDTLRQFGLRFRFSSVLWPERVVACRVSLSSVSSGCAKLLLVETGFPDLFFISIFFDFARLFYEHARPFLLHKQPSSLNFLCHVQICIAVVDCFENSLTNACCTDLFDCDRAYSNTHNALYLPVKGICIYVKIKTSNIRHQILTCL